MGPLLVVLLAFVLIWRMGGESFYYNRFRGGDIDIAAYARRDQLASVWMVLKSYEDKFGKQPSDLGDITQFAPEIIDLLRPPRWSNGRAYQIDFAALKGEGLEIIISDPGFYWPGDRGRRGPFDLFYDAHRVALLNSGEIIWYDEARHRGLVR